MESNQEYIGRQRAMVIERSSNRARVSEEEARRILCSGSNAILHLIDNGDGTFSIMSHINCVRCCYCDDSGDDRRLSYAEALQVKPSKFIDPATLPDEYFIE